MRHSRPIAGTPSAAPVLGHSVGTGKLRIAWLAAAECAALTASSVDLARRVGAVDRRVGVALVSFPLWCAFATALSTAIAHRNPLR